MPTPILPDGTVMTESAAMLLHIHDMVPQAGLVPSDVDRWAVLFNLLMVLVGVVYPTFTFGDEPKQFGLDDAAASILRSESNARRMRIWRHMETLVTPEPYALGIDGNRPVSRGDVGLEAGTRLRKFQPPPPSSSATHSRSDDTFLAGGTRAPARRVFRRAQEADLPAMNHLIQASRAYKGE